MKELNLEKIKKLIGRKTYIAYYEFNKKEKRIEFKFHVRTITTIGVNIKKELTIFLTGDELQEDLFLHDFKSVCLTKKEAVEKLIDDECEINQLMYRTAIKEYKISICRLKAR